MNNVGLGSKGEKMAKDYLVAKGFKMLGQNIRERFGEIDLLGLDKDKTLVFVEVKTLQGSPYGKSAIAPEDNFSNAKAKKMRRIAEFYANAHPEMIDSKMGWRIDLVAITIEGENRTIKHYENV